MQFIKAFPLIIIMLSSPIFNGLQYLSMEASIEQ